MSSAQSSTPQKTGGPATALQPASGGVGPSQSAVPAPSMVSLPVTQSTQGPPATPTKKRKATVKPPDGGDKSDTPRKKAAKGKDKPETLKQKAAREKKEREDFIKARKLRYEPKWGMRRDCPLLDKLPNDLLDQCFNISQGFEMRDWVALAGANTFFRDHINEDVFRELSSSTLRLSPAKKRGPAYHPFSQEIAPWREAHPVTVTVPADPIPSYYVPAGPREKWTKAEYERNKKEKDKWIASERSKRAFNAQVAAAPSHPRKVDEDPKPKIIIYDGSRARVHSIVAGVKPVPKEPVVNAGEWVVPAENEEDQLEAEAPVVRYVNAEHSALAASWPSASRTKAAEDVNKNWIKKSDVAGKYSVTVDELEAIRHALVPTNNKYGTKAHAYQVAAIKALSISIRGGFEGYMEHLNETTAKKQKTAASKQAKIDKAIAEGKPIPQRKKKAPAARRHTAPAHNNFFEQMGFFCMCCEGGNDEEYEDYEDYDGEQY